MNKETLYAKLYYKALQEQKEYLDNLETLSPKEIIDSSYEKVIRDDILMVFENDSLSPNEARELLKLKYPVATCYHAWLKNDCSHMEMLYDTISDLGSKLVKENMREEHNRKKKHKEKSDECR